MDTPDSTAIAELRLRPREDARLRAGHLWIYSNEVDTRATPLKSFEPGQPVRILAASGRPLGTGYVNPHSLICARLVSRDPARVLDRSLLVHRLKVALSLRRRLFGAPCYRLVHGEGDGLPGLVVDRYGEVVVAQILTAGMERVRVAVVEALERVLGPAVVVLRGDSPVRELEGLERYVETVLGEAPEALQVVENGIDFEAPLAGGQKTGWFYDHRLNRARLARYCRDARVLDVFSYVGAWGVQAAVAGARQVLCVDGSRSALEWVERNARRNRVGERVSVRRGDAFEVLRELREARERFDVVILDPPAFIKRRKDAARGLAAYRRINELALRLLDRDGFLLSASCSFHLERSALQRQVLAAGRHLDRELALLEQGHQGPDHPVHPAIPETDYLKALLFRALPAH